jgi:ATP-dependent helicase YprA (DUF1998 family)
MALNPIAFTEQVVADFLRYQLTTYPLADVDLHAQMRALLRLEARRDTPLRRGPVHQPVEALPGGVRASPSSCARGVLHPAMPTVAPFPSLRAHQDEAIRAIHEGRTTLVATGTGSGKTEAFLFPIISRCLELLDAGAPPGIVAVLVYPMNALAEDQLDRLRALLAGRGIPFGMYVGKTPDDEADVKGERMPSGSSNADYRARLAELRTAGAATTLLPRGDADSREAAANPAHQRQAARAAPHPAARHRAFRRRAARLPGVRRGTHLLRRRGGGDGLSRAPAPGVLRQGASRGHLRGDLGDHGRP